MNINTRAILRSAIWFFAAAFCLAGLVGGPIVGSLVPQDFAWNKKVDPLTQSTLEELEHLGLLESAPKGSIKALIKYRRGTGKTVAETLRNPDWAKQLGLSPRRFKATWYMANPYDVLPQGLQEAIRKREIPFRSRTHVWQWCRKNKISKKWRKALYAALIETTPHNLWRASRGGRPFAKNGEFLEPIVIDHGTGHFEVRDGHIATDPRVIPTNSEVLLLLRIKGKHQILKVKATDIGGAIKGKHVDLPIHLSQNVKPLPYTRMPSGQIRNRTVEILKVTSPDQKV